MLLHYTCARCNILLRCKKNGVALVHYNNNDPEQGVDCLRVGDLYKCDICGCEIVEETIEAILDGRVIVEVNV